MPLFDFSIDVLREYLPERTNENDFELFWNDTLAELRRHPLNPRLTAIDCGLVAFDTFDVTFAGWNGEPIKGWFVTPKGATGPLPCVVEYRGYGGGRGLLYDHLVYGSAGYATLVVDSRGQQSAETGDAHIFATGPHAAGFVTDGAQSPEVHYYRRLIGDCVRAIDTARTFRGVA